jgi:hypothetical protein
VTGAGMAKLPDPEAQRNDRLADLYARYVPATIRFAYVRWALERAGFLVERLREPSVREQAVERDAAERRWRRLPNFLHVVAVLRT